MLVRGSRPLQRVISRNPGAWIRSGVRIVFWVDALILHGFRPKHSELGPPTGESEESICAAQKGADLAEFLNVSPLIIWGEAPMAQRHLSEFMGRSIRDIRSGGRPYGGVVVVFGGDSRQTPPVVRRGRRAPIESSSSTTKRSPLWGATKRRMLTRDAMLALGMEESPIYLIRVWGGAADIVGGFEKIELPPDFCADAAGIDVLFEETGRQVSPGVESMFGGERYLVDGAVPAAKTKTSEGLISLF